MASVSYPDLLRQAQPQIIVDEQSHKRALRSVEVLMQKSRISSAERKLLELQAKLINDFEETLYPTPDVSPTSMLSHLMHEQSLTQSELSRECGIARSTISEVLNEKRPISVENAFRLADYFHVEPTLFLSRP